MTVQDVVERVEKIRACKEDPDTAHMLEDKMFVAVLNEIACGTLIARQLAEAALKSQQIPFTRHTS